MTIDLIVKIVNFNNGKIKECVTENEDGSFTIFIDDSLSPEAKCDAYAHALYHIQHDHFGQDVQIIESITHAS